MQATEHKLLINGYGKLLQHLTLKQNTLRGDTYYVNELITIKQLRQSVKENKITQDCVTNLFISLEGYAPNGLNIFQQIDLIEDHLK